jgi:cell division protein FtsZ
LQRFNAPVAVPKAMRPESILLGSGEAKNRPTMRVIGIGGAGCNTISHMGDEGIAVCSDKSHSSLMHHKRVLRLTDNQVKSARSMDPKYAHTLSVGWLEKLKEHVERPDIVFIFVGLGGETGSYVSPLVASICQKLSKLVVVSASEPFSVEGTDRRTAAQEGRQRLQTSCDIPIIYSNDPLLQMAPNLPIRKAFNVMDQIMLSPVYELIDVLTQEDVKGVREDFRGCTKVRLGVGYGGSGLERVSVAVEDAFTSPWFDSPTDMARSAVLVVNSSEPDPYLLEEVMKDVSIRLPRAKIRYSSRGDPALERRIKVTVLVGW